ncbi:MAG TPA: TOBE domain-containing protein [Candidatus Eremiobacteraceae bacterium]|nr:TOBE domain-containing protein [Candidatus Eremiobacteraceae bacterium]
MQVSARNKLPGVVQEIKTDGLMAKVSVRIGDNHLVALITAEAAAEMGLKVGDEATALIKSTSVLLAKAV